MKNSFRLMHLARKTGDVLDVISMLLRILIVAFSLLQTVRALKSPATNNNVE